MRVSASTMVGALFLIAACSSGGANGTDQGGGADAVTGDQGQVQDQGQGQDKGTTDAGEPAFDPPPIDWEWVYDSTDGNSWTGKVEGTQEIGGKTYHIGSLGYMDNNKFVGVRAWFDILSTPIDDIGFLKIEVYDGTQNQGEFGFSYECPDVPAGTINPGDNSELSVNSDCKFMYYDNGVQEMPVHLRLTYQLVDTNESVTVPYGTVDGCWHWKIGFYEDYGTGEEAPIAFEAWLKPVLGIVKMTEVPGFMSGDVTLNKIEKP